MKITRISWQNYRGLADGFIDPDGADVIVSGHNGAGKSSIASVLPFVLFGKNATSVKHFVDGLIPTDDGGLIHSAAVEFENGLSLRREYFWNGNANRHALYVDGQLVKTDEFNAEVRKLTKGAGEIAFNPFAFCEMPVAERRNLLLKIFSAEVEGTDPRFRDADKILDRRPPESFLKFARAQLKDTKAEFDAIPGKIAENQRKLADLPADIDAEIKRIDDQLFKLCAERDLLDRQKEFNFQLVHAQKKLSDAQRAKAIAEKQVQTLTATLQNLRAEYRAVEKSANGTCPTCGQKIPLGKDGSYIRLRLKSIKADGLKAAADLAECKENLVTIEREIVDETTQIKKLGAESNDAQGNLFGDKKTQIEQSINKLSEQKYKLADAVKIRARIDELNAESKSLREKISQLEWEIHHVEEFIQHKVELIEAKIAGNFEHVKFKLFNVNITSGEVKSTCDATLHGVPYSSLSHGERLKAAFDIFKAFQNHFGVELPIFIDDAESYTVNSFVDFPNQLWLFKVTDETQLNIQIVKERRAA